MKTESRVPLIITLGLLVLLGLYVASYLALVRPPNPFAGGSHRMRMQANRYNYRYFDAAAQKVFWPLERIDERIRPEPFWFNHP